MTRSLRLGSLCSGYGGLDLAIEMAVGQPVEHVFVADPDVAASVILAARFPGVPNLGDITKTDWSAVPRVDILAAGFPCQDLSLAGKRRGLAEGTRSGVWFAVVDAIAALRPNLVVVENVRGILSAGAESDVEPCPWCLGDLDEKPPLRALGAVLGDLADLGYDAEWVTVLASDLGAPHQRARVFIVAYPEGRPWRIEYRDGTDAADPAGIGHRDRGTPVVGGIPAAAVGGRDTSLLPTPRTSDQRGIGIHGTGGQDLRTVIALLKTPTAQLGINGGGQHPDIRKAGGHGPTLADQVEHLLPTPAAERSGRQRSASDGAAIRPSLDMINTLLPTPDATHGRKTSRTGPLLAGAVELLPTPRASDGEKGGPNQRGSSGDLMLTSAVHQIAARASAVQVEDVDPLGTSAVGNRVGVGAPGAGDQADAEAGEHFAQLALDFFGADLAKVERGDDGGHVLRGGIHVTNHRSRSSGPQETGATTSGDFGRWGEYGPAIERWEAVLGRRAPEPTEPGPKGGQRLASRFVEWMMGLPDGWVTDPAMWEAYRASLPKKKARKFKRSTARNMQLKALGNGVVILQGAYALRLLCGVTS